MTHKNAADETHRKVKERAYQIWEEEGRPEGRHDEHWTQAESECKSPEKAVLQDKSPDKKPKEAPAKTTRETGENPAQASRLHKSAKQ